MRSQAFIRLRIGLRPFAPMQPTNKAKFKVASLSAASENNELDQIDTPPSLPLSFGAFRCPEVVGQVEIESKG
jgi:hypothetical protein